MKKGLGVSPYFLSDQIGSVTSSVLRVLCDSARQTGRLDLGGANMGLAPGRCRRLHRGV